MSPSDRSSRDSRLLSLVASGLTDKAIAQEMHLSHHTIGDHLKRLMRVMGAKTRGAAAAAFAEARAQSAAAEVCAALCDERAKLWRAATVSTEDADLRNRARALTAEDMAREIRERFNLPRKAA